MGLPVLSSEAQSRASSTIWKAMPMFSPKALMALTLSSGAPAKTAPISQAERMRQAVFPRMMSVYSESVRLTLCMAWSSRISPAAVS